MDTTQNPPVNRHDRHEIRVEDLHLDRVVASHPEIGPTPPDGGYGWLIVFSAVVYHVTVPALSTLYGLMILMAIKSVDHDENEVIRVWDVDIALVPVITIVIRLLLESWCRAVVKIFNMPRFMALSGLCLTVAGVLLSSYSTDADSNDHIINIFSGIFAGAGCALTGQQTEIIITHYFRDRLTTAQRIVRMAPSVGNCLMPILIGFLCKAYTYSSSYVVMTYGAIIMQNCLFLASFTRPIYIERVIRTTYNRLRDAVEDEDEVIFSNQNTAETEQNQPQTSTANDEDANDVVVFKSKQNAKEIMDPAVQSKENLANIAGHTMPRFSSDFSDMIDNPRSSRFSSDFGSLDVTSYSRISGYQELENIDRNGLNPQPLYRETTETQQSGVVFAAEVSPGTARRTASLKKNLITVVNMLRDVNFYLYALLHLTTTMSVFVLSVVFPPLVWVKNPTMNISSVTSLLAVGHGSALCFIMLCIILPKSINEKARLCAVFCIAGAMGFYGIILSSNKSLLVIWCMFVSFSTAASSILQQPLYNTTLNEFDTTATMTTANAIVAIFLMVWSLAYNYTYVTCFETAALLQVVTAVIFFALSFRRRR